MSRRDSILKATAGALQPKSLDLTKFRQRSIEERTRTMSGEQAAGAMGFAAMDWIEDPEDTTTHAGDPLAPALIRLKYAQQRNQGLFNYAHLLLIHRHVGKEMVSDAMFAVALGALFEWIEDACPKCREKRQGAAKPLYCLDCGQRREEQDYRDGEGIWRKRTILVGQPKKDCLKCQGLGRIFKPLRAARGVKCAPCGNTGRRSFTVKERWWYVNDFLRSRPRGRGMDLKVFSKRWLKVFNEFLDVLRKADKNLHAAIDTQISRHENADIVPVPESISEPGELERGAQEEDHIKRTSESGQSPDEPE